MKKTKIETGKPEKLTHSPFAALGGRRQAEAQPTAAEPEQPEATPKAGRVVLRRETKHRGGKAVVIVSGFAALPGFDARAIEALAKECKAKLGCGGTVDGDEIVLQGDRPGEVAELLRDKGFRVAGVTS